VVQRENRDREAAAFGRTAIGQNWSKEDAHKEPQGLRLFSWRW